MKPYTSATDVKARRQDINEMTDLNDLNRMSVLSIEDNAKVGPEFDELPMNKRHGVYGETVRSTLEEVRQYIESTNRQVNYTKPERKKAVRVPSDPDTEETSRKEPFQDDIETNQVHEPYAKHIQMGDQNMMLICEPKEMEAQKVYYKQVGNKNIMVNLTHSSIFYQLLTLAQEMGKNKVFPLDADGEVWLEIKRRSQIFKNKRRQGSKSSTSTVSTSLTSGDSLSYSAGGVAASQRLPGEHDEEEEEGGHIINYDNNLNERTAGEHDDAADTVVLRDSGSFDEDAYSTLDIDEDADHLLMKFEIRNSGKGLDRNYMKKSILSHKKVTEFLLNEGNDFDVRILDWQYQRESTYSYISSQGNTLVENGYSSVRRTHDRPPQLPLRSASNPGSQDAVEGDIDLLYSRVSRNTAQTDAAEEVAQVPPMVPPRRPVPVEDDEGSSVTGSRIPPPPPRSPMPVQRNPLFHMVSLPTRPLVEYSWYCGGIDTFQAKRVLQGKPFGTFLVRESVQGLDGSSPVDMQHTYTIEFVDDRGLCKKLKIMQSANKFHFKDFPDHKFERLPDLIDTIICSGLEIQDETTKRWKNIKVKPIS